MIDPELKGILDEISAKADKAYEAAEKARKYLYWTGIITVVVIVVPLIALAVVIPQFVNTYTSTLNSIGY